MVNSVELMQFCRLCLVKDQVNIPIFEEQGDVHQIFLKISACLPVKVSREDNLPKKICGDCSYKLDLFYQFWNTSANSEKQLLAWLNEIGLNQDALGDVGLQKPESTAQVPTNIILKQEAIEPEPDPPNDGPGNIVSNETQDYILQQQQLPYQASTFPFSNDGNFGAAEASTASGTSNAVANNTREASLKRKRQATATVTQPESEEDDDDDGVDAVETKVAKTEETSDDDRDDDGLEDQESTSFAGMPSTSTDNEQPGPSGMGKNVNEAPCSFVDYSYQVDIKDENEEENEADIKDENGEESVQPEDNKMAHRNRISSERELFLYQCERCKLKCKNKRELRVHMKEIHEPNPFICTICSKTFKNILECRKHKEMEHCKSISGTAIHLGHTKFQVQNYVNKQDESVESLKCEMCGNYYKTPKSLKHHMISQHGDICDMSRCPHCNMMLKATNLTQHIKTQHTNKVIYSCDVCNKSFRNKRHFQLHQVTHQPNYEPSTYKCEKCDRKYTSVQAYKRHLKSHDMTARFVCDVCGKHVTSSTSLRVHIRVHTGEKPFVCENCGKAFNSKSLLRQHTVVHTKARPHICKLCGKTFTQRSPLVMHIRLVHTGERPYSCNMCNEKFTSKTLMKMHMKKHELLPEPT